ncbi:hypothetical protein QMK19_24520 [Streptomyces sp. H10-C2]|uniref:hypothetical protein n=1 Tax=unclassified Streptomyces TaxID=2593676 RepID=UPI0024BAEE3D|nr:MULTISPECIES: hypothetical protein [unclassified Streptomyces]MDJ0343081.1 hypothetical protein [Streptomyces sp. PH10-H1]MDJ0372739.1 hypothetical protein [Streptomyces sp. H10-C2]
MTGRASTTPSPHGLAAVAALARVAPEASRPMLTSTVTILTETQPLPAWHGTGDHRPVRAWQAVDVYDSERVLFIAYDGHVPHTLMVQITEPGGTLVDKLALLAPRRGHRLDGPARRRGRPHAARRTSRPRQPRRPRIGPAHHGHDLAPPR